MPTRITAIVFLALFTAGCASRQASDQDASCGCCVEGSGAAAEQGWVSLFDGTTLNGWRNFRSDTISSGWAVQDGVLARVGEGAGNIVTVGEYGDFELVFDWKVSRAANSGVFYRVGEQDDKGLVSSPEYQVLDNAGHADGKNPKTSAASNYALHAPSRDVTRPVGEWNKGRIVARGNHVEHHLNGVKVVEYELNSPEWRQLVAASKFAKMPGYGSRTRGHIAIQDHGDPVWFRNLKIRELKPTAPRS